MEQQIVSPAGLQQERSLNSSQSYLHLRILDAQERSSRPTTRTPEVHDGPVTAQPVPLELYHPLVPENQQDEGLRIQPASLDDQQLGDGPPGREEQEIAHAKIGVGPPLEDELSPPRGLSNPEEEDAHGSEICATFWRCC